MSVRVIKATKHPNAKSGKSGKRLRVAAYCRVSTDMKEQESSYEAQCRHYTDFIRANPEWELAGIFADEGISGTSTKGRTQFHAMIKACDRGEIDMIITKSISRFARNTLDCLTYIRKLKDLGIPILFEKEGINTMDAKGEILLTIMASIAQQESQSISQNVRIGIQYRMQEGKGRLDTTRFLGLTQRDGKLVIVPGEAELVRRIYRDYLEGYSPLLIAKRLAAEGVAAPAGGEMWYASTVAHILSNEKYCGDLLLQKYYTVDFLSHKIAKNTGQLPQYYIEDDHEPIVPKQLFYQVQGELLRRASLKNSPKVRCSSKMALCGRLICDKCGRTLKRFTKQDGRETDWRCRKRGGEVKEKHRDTKSGCGCRFVPESQAKGAIVAAFNALPEHVPRLKALRTQIWEVDIARIDALVREYDAAEQRLDEQLEKSSAGDQRILLESELARLRSEQTRAMLERAELCSRELQIRLLLELTDQMAEIEKRGRDSATEAAAWQYESNPTCIRGGDQPPPLYDPACRDYDEFFIRTHKSLPSCIFNAYGRVQQFNDDMVVRYIDRITVTDEGFDVHFKVDVKIRITAREIALNPPLQDA